MYDMTIGWWWWEMEEGVRRSDSRWRETLSLSRRCWASRLIQSSMMNKASSERVLDGAAMSSLGVSRSKSSSKADGSTTSTAAGLWEREQLDTFSIVLHRSMRHMQA